MSLSAGKVTLAVFLVVIVCYTIFFITQYIKKNQKQAEHFTELSDAKPMSKAAKDCHLYNIRQEVMNIFELYLKRKPSAEEIAKYEKLDNEQDILVAIVKDFNISSSEVEDKKGTLDGMRKDECVVQEEAHEETLDIIQRKAEIKHEMRKEKPIVETTSQEPKGKEAYQDNLADYNTALAPTHIALERKDYEELKNKVKTLMTYVEDMDHKS